ncbi:MAG TPA: NAD-binding protein, partial [Planctomycetota bacterium]|nr:NAD-binding protein [Planctomycetota bacterium]
MVNRNRALYWEIAIVTSVVVAVVCIGYAGLDDYYNVRNEKHYSPSTVFYMTLQFFTLQFALIDSPKDGALNWQIELARFAAPLLSSYAVVRAMTEIFAEPLKAARVSFLRNHVVICGLSQKGFALVKDFRSRGVPVVLVEWDKENDLLENCRDVGAYLVMGDATEELTLRKAACGHARLLFAVCDEDGVNAEIGMLAQTLVMRETGKAPLDMYLHIENLKLCALLRAHGVNERKSAGTRMRIFNIHENAARFVLKDHPLDGDGIRSDDARTVHLLIIGFSRMGETLALHAAQIGHFANGKKLKLTLVDRQMKARSTPFRARYPQFEQACDVEYWNEDYEEPKVLECIERYARDEARLLTIAVCLAEDGVSLACALRCAEILRERGVPILVRLDSDSGLALLAEDSRGSHAARIRTFVVGGSFCSEKEIVEKDRNKLARAIHDDARSRADSAHPA